MGIKEMLGVQLIEALGADGAATVRCQHGPHVAAWLSEIASSLNAHAPALLYGAVGWQGGTIHQLVKEIERLKRCEAALCELVNLKKLKAEIEALELAEGEPYTMAKSVYEQRKALAWPMAFDLVGDVRTAVTLSAVVQRVAYLAGELVLQLSAGEEVPQHLEAGDVVQIQC